MGRFLVTLPFPTPVSVLVTKGELRQINILPSYENALCEPRKESVLDETQRSRVYLEVPQRNAGLIDLHSLHIFHAQLSRINACKVIGVKIRPPAVKNHFCHRKYRSGSLVRIKRNTTKLPKRRSLCHSFLHLVQRIQIA